MLMVKLPLNEIIWVRYYDILNRITHVITSDKRRDNYYIYKVFPDGNTERLYRGKDPQELEQKVFGQKRRA